MLTFLYISAFSPGRSLAFKQGSILPSPPPPTTPPITFLIVLSLSTIPWFLADVLKSILGISRTDPWRQANFFSLSTPPAGGAYLFRAHLRRGGGLIKTRGDGSLTTIFIWNYPTLPLKNEKISSNAGKGGPGNLIRLPFCLFSAQTRRPPFFDWALPEGQPDNKCALYITCTTFSGNETFYYCFYTAGS